ncbi:MAG: RNA-directed DNA polymerase [Candidatus Sulfotelmatobacter sp.]
MTIYRTLLSRGYFPKELPPAFFTEQFGKYATTKKGRAVISEYRPADKFTQCVSYQLARPGSDRRELKIPHPASFSKLASLTGKYFGRLLRKAGSSPFSKSRPLYVVGANRAIRPRFKPSNLPRERAACRSGSSFVLKTDVSQFYPSLYTHAVGWALDPRLRNKAHWGNTRLLGKKIDQAFMDLDGKISRGIPIGNDISFLVAEMVLAQIDQRLREQQGK